MCPAPVNSCCHKVNEILSSGTCSQSKGRRGRPERVASKCDGVKGYSYRTVRSWPAERRPKNWSRWRCGKREPYNMHSLPPAESRHSVSALAGVYSSQNPKTHQRRSLSHGRDIGSAHATFASQEGQICKLKMSQFDAIRGNACAGMFSRMGKMRRPRVTRSISRYRVAEAGKLAVSKCKLKIFTMRRILFGRTGQSSRQWLGKNWRKAVATSSSPHLDGI